MPSNHTANYKLSQWVKTDKVLMDDFNADNAAIDAALKALDTSLTGKASSSSLSSLQSTVNGKASQSELDALKSTVTALQSTVAAKQDVSGAVKIATGSYNGDGKSGETNARTLNFSSSLGKLPELLIVRGTSGLADGLILLRGMSSTTMNLSGATGSGSVVYATWNATAKTVSWYGNNATSQFNTDGKEYRWFAIG